MVCIFGFKIFQSRENNISGVTKTKKLMQSNLLVYPLVDGNLW